MNKTNNDFTQLEKIAITPIHETKTPKWPLLIAIGCPLIGAILWINSATITPIIKINAWAYKNIPLLTQKSTQMGIITTVFVKKNTFIKKNQPICIIQTKNDTHIEYSKITGKIKYVFINKGDYITKDNTVIAAESNDSLNDQNIFLTAVDKKVLKNLKKGMTVRLKSASTKQKTTTKISYISHKKITNTHDLNSIIKTIPKINEKYLVKLHQKAHKNNQYIKHNQKFNGRIQLNPISLKTIVKNVTLPLLNY